MREPNRPRQERLHVWSAFVHAHATVVDAIEAELETQQGMSLRSFEVLLRLGEGGEAGLRMQELAGLVMLSKSGLTRLVDRLEATGYVARRSCPTDRRGTLAVLTSDGCAALEEARPLVLRAIDRQFLSHLSGEEADALLAIFRRMLEAHGSRAGLEACGGGC